MHLDAARSLLVMTEVMRDTVQDFLTIGSARSFVGGGSLHHARVRCCFEHSFRFMRHDATTGAGRCDRYLCGCVCGPISSIVLDVTVSLDGDDTTCD